MAIVARKVVERHKIEEIYVRDLYFGSIVYTGDAFHSGCHPFAGRVS